MPEPDKPNMLRSLLPWLPAIILAPPLLAGLYFAQKNVTPEAVCDLKIHMVKTDIRWCVVSGGTARECLK